MPREGIPINSAIIAWARKRAGLSEQEAAKKFTKIGAWEAGSALPTYPQLEKLADEFKLPVAVFFLPDVPNVPPIRESFRTLPDTEFDQIPRQVSALLRKAKALQLNLSELTGGRNPAPRRRMAKLNYSASPPAPRPCHILGDAPIPSGGAPPARCERSWIIRSRLPREHSCRCARSRHLSGRRLVSFDHGCCTTSRAHVFRFETSTNPNGGVIFGSRLLTLSLVPCASHVPMFTSLPWF